MQATRRDVLKVVGASLGGSLIEWHAHATAAPAYASAGSGSSSTSSSAALTSLQSFLAARASPTFSLPSLMTSPPQISWAGPMATWPVATSLPGGAIYPASSNLFGGPIRSRFTPSLPGNPSIAGNPALKVARPYSCKGVAQTIGSPTVMRFSTDAAVVELAGVTLVNAYTSQTLIVSGQRVQPKVLSVSNGNGGGYDPVGARIDFGSSGMRDIWVETGMYVSYVKIGASDTLVGATDAADPQMTVVGDSYQILVGSSAFGNAGALAMEIGARLGIGKVATDAVIGSGYWNSGYNVGNLNDRLPAHAADNSAIYLVMAGINDYVDYINPPQDVWPTRAQYEGAVASYFQGLRAAQPSAVIVATAPFSPNPTLSDASYVQNASTNTSGLGDFPYKSQVQMNALSQIAGPWVWIDVLGGTGWTNSSGASGGASGLPWFTGGTPAAGTTSTFKPGNLNGGSGAGFGGIASVPLLAGGSYAQAPDITASGGSGSGLLLASSIDSTGAINSVTVVRPGMGYTAGAGLPALIIDSTFQRTSAQLGAPVLMSGINPAGSYPLQSSTTATPGGYSNAYVLIMPDLLHPSPAGMDYLASRLAQCLYEGVMAL
jgi:lysophospholipase L1-like esterase